jgi:hypothetical protein
MQRPNFWPEDVWLREGRGPIKKAQRKSYMFKGKKLWGCYAAGGTDVVGVFVLSEYEKKDIAESSMNKYYLILYHMHCIYLVMLMAPRGNPGHQ